MSFLNDPTVEHLINGESYAKAVSNHIEDCNWAMACERAHEYALKNPPESSVPDWCWMLVLLILLGLKGEKNDPSKLS